jgi:hypothetical protein
MRNRPLIVASGLVVLLCVLLYVRPAKRPVGFASRSQPTDCINNLRILEGAVSQFEVDHGKTNSPSTISDLAPYLHNKQLLCPAGGRYDLRGAVLEPVCSLGTNPATWERHGFLSYTYTSDSGNMHRLP